METANKLGNNSPIVSEKSMLSKYESIIEGLLYASGDELTAEKIATIIEIDKKTVKSILVNMIDKYRNSDRGIMIREINGGYQFCTRFEHYSYVKKLFEPKKTKQGLSQASFESLAIIAYKQPITKAKLESIRGVNCDSSLSKLLDNELIKEGGRMDAPGKPILYVTTKEFLKKFGLNSLAELKGFEIQHEILKEDGSIQDGVKCGIAN